MKKPELIPPCSGWREDLPRPDELPVVAPALGFDAPNLQDGLLLELPRASSFARGWLTWLGLLQGFLMLDMLWSHLEIYRQLGFDEWAMFIFTAFVGVWTFLFCMKIELAPPRDMPLRFNRARQRLYAYNFNYRWWNPFERWRIEPVAYDWSQVRAERWLKRGATAQGGLVIKGGVVLSIVKPGTNEVIDRFPLTTMGADEHAWAYICTYMQQGPDALPPPGPPKDHNDVSWCNIALLLAPKVKWPADMDRESRTAP